MQAPSATAGRWSRRERALGCRRPAGGPVRQGEAPCERQTPRRRPRRARRLLTAAAAAVALVGLVALDRRAGGRRVRAPAPGPWATRPATSSRPATTAACRPTSDSTDQLPLYDGLTPLRDDVTGADIDSKFLPEDFTPIGATTEEQTGRPGLRLLYDSYGIAHIYGQTRYDVAFGAGWATARDRLLLLLLGRGPARAAVADVPGIDAFSPGHERPVVRPERRDRGARHRPGDSSSSRRTAPRAGRSSPTPRRTPTA